MRQHQHVAVNAPESGVARLARRGLGSLFGPRNLDATHSEGHGPALAESPAEGRPGARVRAQAVIDVNRSRLYGTIPEEMQKRHGIDAARQADGDPLALQRVIGDEPGDRSGWLTARPLP